jgi:predicted RNase H-like nuclease
LAHSLNLDATKIGQRPDTRVHVKQMKCSNKLMDLFWIMYQVLEEEDDYLIFLDASLINSSKFLNNKQKQK